MTHYITFKIIGTHTCTHTHTYNSRAGLRDCGALGKVILGGPPEKVVANHILSMYEQNLIKHRT